MFVPTLIFEMKLPKFRSWELLTGSLTLKETAASAGIKFLATSGCCGHQYSQSYLLPGRGCLPPSEAIAPKSWEIDTSPVYLPAVKGINGNFYPIKPFAVTVLGVTRSDLGLHQDTNVPGSAGCVVIRDKQHWQILQERLQRYASQGIKKLPLTVKYTIA